MALKKFCRCGKIISQEKKMCEKCEERFLKINKKSYNDYKAKRTDIKEQKFYCSKDWIITRDVVKQRDKGLCQLCLFKEKIKSSDTVHHIEPLKDNWNRRVSLDNLVSLCDRCHWYVHMKYERDNKKLMQSELKLLISKSNCND